MPSNVRRYERSCKTRFKEGDQVFQCQTCDSKGHLYLCLHCRDKGAHNGHKIKLVEFRFDFYFCNCGDITGLLCCSEHMRRSVCDSDKPLHYNDIRIDEFITIFKIEKFSLFKLARLNQIKKLGPLSTDYLMIEHYFKNSNSHSSPIRMKGAWSTYRKDREEDFIVNGFEKHKRFLLWHGTKVDKLLNILKRGLQKPNDDLGRTQVTGAMYGKGIYFADRVSKSAQYSDSSGPGLLLLCEVALGRMWRADKASNYERVPPKHDSIKGVGTRVPDRTGRRMFDRDITVPSGSTINNPSPSVSNPQLVHNEYIVFNSSRVLIRFIVHFEQDHSIRLSRPVRNTLRPITRPPAMTLNPSAFTTRPMPSVPTPTTRTVLPQSISRPSTTRSPQSPAIRQYIPPSPPPPSSIGYTRIRSPSTSSVYNQQQRQRNRNKCCCCCIS